MPDENGGNEHRWDLVLAKRMLYACLDPSKRPSPYSKFIFDMDPDLKLSLHPLDVLR
jgi:hypothetical protein